MSNSEIGDIYHEVTEHSDEYETARCYAEDGGDLVTSDPTLRKTLNKRADKMRFNFSGAIVNAYRSRLLLSEIDIATMSPEGVAEFLEKVNWGVQHAVHIADLCKYGDAYMIVWPYESDEYGEFVTIRAIDPLSTRVFYSPEDDEPELAARAWTEKKDGQTIYRVNVYDKKELRRWSSVNGSDWSPYEIYDADDKIEEAAVVPYDPKIVGTIPILHTRTDYNYGKPVHLESYGSQDMVMRTVVGHASALEFQGWPQLWALYDWTTAGGTSEMGDTMAADEGADDAREEVATLVRDPGSIWALRAKEIGQLQPASAENFLTTLDKYIDTASALCGIPRNMFASPGGQQPSAESQRVAKADFDQAIARLERELTGTFRKALALGLTAVGTPTSAKDVDIQWKKSEIQSDGEFWQTALTKQEAGVTIEQTLIEGGYSSDQVEEFLKDSGDEASLLRRVEIVNTLADAVSKLSAATATGVISEARVNALLDSIFSSAENTTEEGVARAEEVAEETEAAAEAEDVTVEEEDGDDTNE